MQKTIIYQIILFLYAICVFEYLCKQWNNADMEPKIENIEYKRLELIADKYFISIYKMSEMTGKTRQFLNTYKYKKFGRKVLDELENLFGINPMYLKTGEGEMFIRQPGESFLKVFKESEGTNPPVSNAEPYVEPTNGDDKRIEYLSVPANAGFGYSFDDMPVLYLSEPPKYYRKSFKQCLILGESMYPEIKNGSVVTFDTEKEPIDSDFVIATVDGVLLCKQYKIIDDIAWLNSINPSFENYKLNGFSNYQIHGVIIEINLKLR